MSWKIAGSYFETCSCDVVCPCTASLALGATNDYCRVVLVFHLKDGEVEGVDVSGLTVAAVADTPKLMTDGNWRLGVFIDAAASDEQAEKLGRGLRRATRWADGGARAARRREPGRRACPDRDPRGGSAAQREDRQRRRLRDRGHRSLRRRVGSTGALDGHLPPGRIRADDRKGHTRARERLRYRVRRKGRLLDVEVCLGCLITALGNEARARAQRWWRRGRREPGPYPRRARPSRPK